MVQKDGRFSEVLHYGPVCFPTPNEGSGLGTFQNLNNAFRLKILFNFIQDNQRFQNLFALFCLYLKFPACYNNEL